jgi:hypothetical protein
MTRKRTQPTGPRACSMLEQSHAHCDPNISTHPRTPKRRYRYLLAHYNQHQVADPRTGGSPQPHVLLAPIATMLSDAVSTTEERTKAAVSANTRSVKAIL